MNPAAVQARRGAVAVSATGLVVAGANYAFALVLVHLLAPEQYVPYAAAQSLLLLLGSGAMAAIPWAIAALVARTPREAGAAFGFGLTAAAMQGALFAALAAAVVVRSGGWGIAACTALAAFSLSIVVAPLGVLQGQGRFTTIAVLRLAEAVVRIAVALTLLLTLARRATGPLLGFTAGSVVLFAGATWACRGVLPLTRGRGGELARQAAWLGSVQLALASLGVVDSIVVAATSLPTQDQVAYQVASLLGRVPLFAAASVALAYFPAMSAGSSSAARATLAQATRVLRALVVPVACVLASAPPWLLDRVTGPHAASQVHALLPFTAAAGVLVAAVTVLVTYMQARRQHVTALLLAGPIALGQPVVLLIAANRGAVAYASANLALVACACGAAMWQLRSTHAASGVARHAAAGGALAGGTVLAWFVPSWWWLLAAAAGVVGARAVLTILRDAQEASAIG